MKYNLFTVGIIKNLAKTRWWLFILRLVFVLLFGLIVYAGLFGGTYRNIASVATGIIWLTLISIFAIIFGKVWCTVCPWNTIAGWFGAISGKKRLESSKPDIPPFLRKLWLPVTLLCVMVFLEYSIGISLNPRMTAYIGLAMVALAIIFVFLFNRKSFCRYACPVGIMSGLYALFAPFELRSINQDVCAKCPNKDCLNGNEKGVGCPVFEFPSTMDTNMHCTLCLECPKACPYDNITINARAPASDLKSAHTDNHSYNFLVILLLLFTLFHAFYTSALGIRVNEYMVTRFSFNQYHISALFVMAILAVTIMKSFSVSLFGFSSRIHAFIPVLIFTHLGLIIKQFSIHIKEMLYTLNDPFGWNWNLFGNTDWISSIMSGWKMQPGVWYCQIALMVIGVAYGIYLLMRRGRNVSAGLSVFSSLIYAALILWLSIPV
ncbi:MAG: 4Fe-4S binding protein [Planctomycetes bacterium]|nr:4Fe-4S binding protein [Planctomycetota bacterium]